MEVNAVDHLPFFNGMISWRFFDGIYTTIHNNDKILF
jgi:hypothetical protein